MNNRQKVLSRLIYARQISEYFWRHQEHTPEGWVPADVLMHPDIGGISALRRVRELRRSGFNIVWKFFHTSDGQRTQTTLYYLDMDPALINLNEMSIRKAPAAEQGVLAL